MCIVNNTKFCPEEYPYLIKEKNECSQNCSVSDLFNNVCNSNNPNIVLKQKVLDNIRNAITSNSINELLNNVLENGEDLFVDDMPVKYQITSSSNQNNKEYNDISTIKLGECENKLKRFYNISEDDNLLIFKADIYLEGLLTPIVIYEIYHPKTKEKLDIIHCQDIKINISLPAKINEDELYKYDPKNNFYNDICFTHTSKNGTDITLNDRQDEFINNNLTLCENGCDYNSYNEKTQKVTCDCFIKLELPFISDIKFDKEKLKKNFLDMKSIVNIKIMKCYKVLFTKKGLIKNIGSYIISTVIFIYLISYNVFFMVEYDKLIDIIDKIIKNKLYNKKQCNNIQITMNL